MAGELSRSTVRSLKSTKKVGKNHKKTYKNGATEKMQEWNVDFKIFLYFFSDFSQLWQREPGGKVIRTPQQEVNSPARTVTRLKIAILFHWLLSQEQQIIYYNILFYKTLSYLLLSSKKDASAVWYF